jgi:2-dehydropantoate 2-reductase
MKILIYGGGAVGLGVASCLLKSGQETTILARPETVSQLRSKGLVRTGIFGDFVAPPGSFEACASLSEVRGTVFDYILVATKSFDSEPAAQDLLDHYRLLGDQGKIVLFQNGWGNGGIFGRFFDRERIYNARVITGFIRPEKNRVEITVHAEPIHIGSIFGSALEPLQPLCRAISEGGIPCEPSPQIIKDLWAKMLFNCPLNSLGAVCGVTYGALGASPWARNILDRMTREIFGVMDKAGFATHWNTPEDYLKVFYAELLPHTAGHYSSTLQDLRAGRKTEIDALNGAVVRLGRELDVPTPVSETLHAMIKFLEKAG